MERLTKKEMLAGHEVNYVSGDDCFCVWSTPKKFMGEAIDRLAAYEDTGLEPEEITTEPYGCAFYCNRKCNLDGDFCAEGPGCPHEVNAETAKHLLELAQAEKDGRLMVHGRWIPFRSGIAGEIQYCSVCEIGFEEMTDFCPHCGAKMDLPEAVLKKREETDNEAV